MKAHTAESQANLNPDMAIQYLKEGNLRFLKNLKTNRDLLQQVNETRNGQYPFAAILSCSDSRTSTELIFDQGLGDIFSVRLAGNVASTYATASLEFACKYLGSKVVVVLGHTQCGAIKGACDGFEDGNITELLKEIEGAVAMENQTTLDRSSDNEDFVFNVMKNNIKFQMDKILEKSELLRELIRQEKLKIVGASYDVSSGIVTFYD
jgi:carbonic anhydrase